MAGYTNYYKMAKLRKVSIPLENGEKSEVVLEGSIVYLKSTETTLRDFSTERLWRLTEKLGIDPYSRKGRNTQLKLIDLILEAQEEQQR